MIEYPEAFLITEEEEEEMLTVPFETGTAI